MVDVGQKAPNFQLVDTELRPRSLQEFLGNGKPVVLAFFPGAFTSVCTKEMCTFRDSFGRLQGANANLVAISVDGPFANKAFAAENNLPFPVLSDYNREVIRLYDVYHEDFAGLKGYTAAKRAIFVLDETGTVRYRWVTENPAMEPPYEEVFQAVEQLRR
ncbi:MAG: peroxiredoxin [Candidatus Kapabacteria bacterium]|nr:peroxiredoxin [Candidatus Kapabacteria bacterium]MDW8012827.1 peroxiredoxin [Bacteroidota bacterium]